MAEFTIAWADGLTRRPFQVSSGSVRAPQPQPSADVPPDAPLPPDMVVFVRMLSGEAVELEAAADDSVATLKATLEQRVGVPRQAQRLLRPGHASPLADASTLRASGVASGDTLHLAVDASVGEGGAASYRGAMSHVVSDMPWGRCVVAFAMYASLYWHVSLVGKNCCAATGLPWQPGANGGVCECRANGTSCVAGRGCCQFGSCQHRALDLMRGGDKEAINDDEEAIDGDKGAIDDDDDELLMFCVADASELGVAPRAPDCVCCSPEQKHGRVEDNRVAFECSLASFLILWLVLLMVDVDCTLWVSERNSTLRMQVCCGADRHRRGSLLSMLCRGRDAHGKGASALKSCTRAACETAPRLVMTTECSHFETIQGVDRRGRKSERTVRVVTARVKREFPVDVVPEPAMPLEAVKRGGVWEIENPDKEGARRISRSRRGLLELRVTLDLEWATDEDGRACAAAFEQFCAASRYDESQRHWIVAHFDTVEQRTMWELEEDGAPPSCLNVPCFLLASVLGLGWLYQMCVGRVRPDRRCISPLTRARRSPSAGGTTRSRRLSSFTSRRRSTRAAVATSKPVLDYNPAIARLRLDAFRAGSFRVRFQFPRGPPLEGHFGAQVNTRSRNRATKAPRAPGRDRQSRRGRSPRERASPPPRRSPGGRRDCTRAGRHRSRP